MAKKFFFFFYVYEKNKNCIKMHKKFLWNYKEEFLNSKLVFYFLLFEFLIELFHSVFIKNSRTCNIGVLKHHDLYFLTLNVRIIRSNVQKLIVSLKATIFVMHFFFMLIFEEIQFSRKLFLQVERNEIPHRNLVVAKHCIPQNF